MEEQRGLEDSPKFQVFKQYLGSQHKGKNTSSSYKAVSQTRGGWGNRVQSGERWCSQPGGGLLTIFSSAVLTIRAQGNKVWAHSLSCCSVVSENPRLLFSEFTAVGLRWICSSYPRQHNGDYDLQTHRIILAIAVNIYRALNSSQTPH